MLVCSLPLAFIRSNFRAKPSRNKHQHMDLTKVDLRRTLDSLEEPELPPPKRPARPRKPSPPLYKASVSELAETGVAARSSSSTADIDNAIISRIKKCLDRANHPNTPEAEAKAALHLGSRLMGQYNVSQAEVLAHESPEKQRQYAGHSVVSITRFDGDDSRAMRQQRYIGTLCYAMERFFDCKSYSTAGYSSLDMTFYGIAENTVAAAMSFEMAFNLISEWVRPYKGVGSKNSYCHGVCDELLRVAREEKVNEEVQAKKAESEAIATKAKQEDAERAAQLERLVVPTKELHYAEGSGQDAPEVGPVAAPSDDSDRVENEHSDHDSPLSDVEADGTLEDFVKPDFDRREEKLLDVFGDLDQEIETLVKQEPQSFEAGFGERLQSIPPAPPPQDDDHFQESSHHKLEETLLGEVKKEEPESDLGLEAKWASHSQLVVFRDAAATIADEYLEGRNILLHQRSGRRTTVRDEGAYRQGRKDSNKIDVHRKRISDSVSSLLFLKVSQPASPSATRKISS